MTTNPDTFQQLVLQWFEQHGRKQLPWQQSISPYRVWVSEIMLQQTQVNTVIPYFNRFMEAFANLQALAAAPEDKVLHLWTGLGYYSRARNLHKAAKKIIHEFAGQFPDNLDTLQQLSGVGRSTAGAILSIAYGVPAAILDGNVKRVLSRYAAISGYNGQPAFEKNLWQLAEYYTPQQRCGEYAQVMMDLGATICTRSKPRCNICPLQASCQGFALGNPTQFPAKKPKKTLPVKTGTLLLLQNHSGHILLEKRPGMGIWGGLWCLPEYNEEHDLAGWCLQNFGVLIETVENLATFRHTFSHYHYDITPLRITASLSPHCVRETAAYLWYDANHPAKIGLPAPIKKLLERNQHVV